jgi:hypothetical protein
MVTTRIKEHAPARKKLARLEPTIATELPQELSKLPEQYGFAGVNPFLKPVKSEPHGGNRGKDGHQKKAAAVPKTRQRAVIPSTGYTDDGHPTILAAIRG